MVLAGSILRSGDFDSEAEREVDELDWTFHLVDFFGGVGGVDGGVDLGTPSESDGGSSPMSDDEDGLGGLLPLDSGPFL